ncbi:MAG: UDP-N-acetylmuramoyl-L-alanyl-D-glutamate--2,6-diaminopimelate ligase [Rhodospirillales bacterium]|nr:UDP-N-acetylmuramoyl-L-alanyl-D-glutamate--2,6-diaminopimelate ligase [Rhodospirillales bacterium]
MRLTDLLNGFDVEVTGTTESKRSHITGLTSDSRQVKPGYLFAALPGGRTDGTAFISESIARGAAAVLTRAPDFERRESVAVIVDANPRRRLALLASRFYGRQPDVVAAVTGTNGKTSVVSFLRQIWTHAGRAAASVGTLGVQAPDAARSGSLTTPDPVELHATLAELADAGVDHLALEASSHGLSQHRLDGVRIAAAAFTNLTREHLDYHGSMADYLDAKRRLFAELVDAGGSCVVNADDAAGAEMIAAAEPRGIAVMTYGHAGRDVRLTAITPAAEGQRLELVVEGKTHCVSVPLVGVFQASNALCAAALAMATRVPAEVTVQALMALQGVRGRLELAARLDSGARVYVDYAHTPDALAAALAALRPHAAGRLIVVFGCGGDRDAGKRPEMGRIAAVLADHVIVTDDNPRGEDSAAIRRAILAGCPSATEIGDRAEAIAAAVAMLGTGDVLLIAGKGHETGQIVGDRVLPFDDAAAVRCAAAGRQA